MGCGESKHAVSTADTISQSKRSSDHTKYEKIKQNNEEENAAAAMPEIVGEKHEKEGEPAGQVSFTEANVKGSENVSNEKEGENPKAEDVVDQEKEETGVEKVKADEIKEVPPPPAAVVVEDDTKKPESEAKNEEPKKEENEASPIKEKEAEKSEELKGLINAGEEKIPSVEEKADESAAKGAKST